MKENNVIKACCFILIFILLFSSASYANNSFISSKQRVVKNLSTISFEEAQKIFNHIVFSSGNGKYWYYWRELLSILGIRDSKGQYTFSKKLIQYLQSGLSHMEGNQKTYIINQLEEGHCGGYSSLWVYYKWLNSKQAGIIEDQCVTVPRRKDEKWLEYNIALVNK